MFIVVSLVSLFPVILSQWAFSFRGRESLTFLDTRCPYGPCPSKIPQKIVSSFNPKFWEQQLQNCIQNFNSYIFFSINSEKKEDWTQTSQTSMESWLTPFFPCLVNNEAESLEPLLNILPGIPCSHSSLCELNVDNPHDRNKLLLNLFLNLLDELDAEEENTEHAFPWSTDRQEPIRRALMMLTKQSRTATKL